MKEPVPEWCGFFFPDNKRILEYACDNCELCKAKYDFLSNLKKIAYSVSNSVAESFATTSVGPGFFFYK